MIELTKILEDLIEKNVNEAIRYWWEEEQPVIVIKHDFKKKKNKWNFTISVLGPDKPYGYGVYYIEDDLIELIRENFEDFDSVEDNVKALRSLANQILDLSYKVEKDPTCVY